MALVELTHTDHIVTAEFNRAEKHNALSPELIESLHEALDALERDQDMRVLILGGLGKSFCAGMDLRGVLNDVNAMGEMLSGLGRATYRLRQLPVPVIARVQGAAIGGGVWVCRRGRPSHHPPRGQAWLPRSEPWHLPRSRGAMAYSKNWGWPSPCDAAARRHSERRGGL